MIQSVVGICLMFVGFAVGRPVAQKGLFLPVPAGSRPACAEKTLTFCEKVDNYPSELIENLLKSKKFDVNDFFVDESGGLDDPPEYILNRTAPDDTEEDEDEEKNRTYRSARAVTPGKNLSTRCSVPSRMAAPQIASNEKGEWRFIAQEESSKIQQEVKVHMCAEKKECQQSCTQFYRPISLQSVTSDEKIIEDIFWFPSSCRCFNSTENAL